jgi:hypothetical protein
MKISWTEGRMLDRLGLLFFAATMASIALFGALRPAFNWDMIPYVALAEERSGMNSAVRHDRAYQVVHAAAPAKDWALLTQANDYRAHQYANPHLFDTQLGMYRIKVGYIAAARMLNAFVPTICAFRLINLLALIMLSAVVMWWMRIGRFGRAAFFLVPVLLIAKLPAATQLVTPDLLCASFAVAGLALLRRGPWPLASACFAAATLARPDFILFPGALLAVAMLTRTGMKEAASSFAAAAAAYGLTLLVGDHPGWWPHFSVSLIERVDDLNTVQPFSFGAYLHGFAKAMLANLTTQIWPALALLLSACWLSLQDRQGYRSRQADGLFLALILSLAARCIIFPMPDDRLYLPTVIMLALIVVERWGEGPSVRERSEAVRTDLALE